MIRADTERNREIGFQFLLDSMTPGSPYGRERIKNLRFFAPHEREELERELDNLSRVVKSYDSHEGYYERIRQEIGRLKEIRGTLCHGREGRCFSQIELFELKQFLIISGWLCEMLEKSEIRLQGIDINPCREAILIIDPISPDSSGFYLSDGRTQALETIRKEKRFLESKLYKAQNGEEKRELLSRRNEICLREENEELKIREDISRRLAPYLDILEQNANVIGDLDFLLQKAGLAVNFGGKRPELTADTLELKGMYNPQVGCILEESGRSFLPVSIALNPGATVITGANMGGKSVSLKTIALNVLLCHAGMFTFAEKARIPLFDSVYCLFDSRQSMEKGLSGFGAEIMSFNSAFSQVEEGFSLFLLDEFARGTNPQEGTAIVKGITAYMDTQSSITVLATHYDHVAECASAQYQVIGLRDMDWEEASMEVKSHPGSELDVIGKHMNYGLYQVMGSSDCPREAFKICTLLNMDEKILKEIKKYY